MATAVAPPVSALRSPDGVMNTLPRPEDGADAASVHENGDDAYKPDLSKEVAMLSTKLINAINHQTNLDDSLQATRHELDWARQEVKRVQTEKRSIEDAIAQGVLVRRTEFDKTIADLRAQLAVEKMSRETAERSKKQVEGELENLTSSLFEEANKMVEEAKKETKAVEKRNSQLKSQLNDQEAMLKSQQEQIQDIRLTLERTETSARESGSTPGTPITSAGTTGADFDVPHPQTTLPSSATIPPDHPLHFSQLITPILRNDVSSYSDFAELLAWARRGAPHSRSASGNVASASTTNLSSTNVAMAATTSSPNLPGAFSFGSSSANSSPNSSSFNGAYAFMPPLKESKFYKRALIEDIEPTLRLDLAPGLSFLSRRTVNSALLNGTLSIEPFTPPTKFYSPIFACALCGEARKAEPYIRRHRFRTSESEDASKYPLCEFCLGRVRSAADFVSFLRMVRDGHWRCEGEEEERKAWEESVRLRERMFWARLGGGVVPASILDRQREGGAGADGRVEWEADAEGRVDKGRWSGLLRGTGVETRPSEAAAPIPEDGTVELARADESESAERQLQDEIDQSDEGIGRAIVNMASQAASSAMPELKPQESSAFHTPEQEMPPPVITPDADSDVEQAGADTQLRDEASKADQSSEVETTQRPDTSGEEAATAKAEDTATVRPAGPDSEMNQPSRPSTATSMSSQRTLSPSKSATDPASERRPSSVLARVRAMEAKASR